MLFQQGPLLLRIIALRSIRMRFRIIQFLRVTTTNDNLNALRFYQRRGFRITAVRPGAVDEARRTKPSISTSGEDGIPIHDEIELERQV